MGVIERYRDRLPLEDGDPVVTLNEGSTPLILAERLSERLGIETFLKIEGANPTGSFKDRGMTVAVSRAKGAGAEAIICASTGNTAASAAAYAARAGMRGAVIVPEGKIARGKLAQSLICGARVVALHGNFDQALKLVCEVVERNKVEFQESFQRALANWFQGFKVLLAWCAVFFLFFGLLLVLIGFNFLAGLLPLIGNAASLSPEALVGALGSGFLALVLSFLVLLVVGTLLAPFTMLLTAVAFAEGLGLRASLQRVIALGRAH